MDEISHHKIQDKHKDLPIRWMSIESVREGIFTVHSDVVSTIIYCSLHSQTKSEHNYVNKFYY